MKLFPLWTAILGSFAIGLSGWAIAEETVSPAEAAAAPAEEAAAPAAETSAAAVPEEDEEIAAATDLALVLPPAPPRSLQSLVDERREELQKKRRARFDRYSGRYFYLPPGLQARDAVMDRYRDVIREVQRQQRDYSRVHRDNLMSYLAPWAKPHRDWAEARHYAIQMEQLDWEELRDDIMLAPPFAHIGPIGPLY